MFKSNQFVGENDKYQGIHEKALLSHMYLWVETRVFESYSLLAYHARVHISAYILQSIIGFLQYAHLLSDDYLPFKVSRMCGHTSIVSNIFMYAWNHANYYVFT